MEAFAINNKDSFFGREEILSQLIASAKGGNCLQIVGARRFGKTFLMEVCYQKLLSDKNYNVIPVFLDVKSDGIKGDVQVFEYFIAKLIIALFGYNGCINTEIVNFIIVEANTKWIDIYERLEELHHSKQRLQECLKDVISSTENKVLFMIDEYEFLFTSAFSAPDAFMPLRYVASHSEYGFSFWIAGSVTWGKFCKDNGSGELNVISDSDSKRLSNIEKNQFSAMWDYECSFIENVETKKSIKSKENFVFEQSGGIPFYAKIIGRHLLNAPNCDYTILSNHFKEIVKNLNDKELEFLKEISKQNKLAYNGNIANDLLDAGLIKRINNGRECIFAIPLLKDYVYNLTKSDAEVVSSPKPQQEELVENILKRIEDINTQYKNKRRRYLFEPSNNQFSEQEKLSKCVQSKDDYHIFSSVLYTFYYERIKDNTEPLISSYKTQNSAFANIVDTNRHIYGGGHRADRFNPKVGRWTKERLLLELTGSKNEPILPSDFQQMQLEILRRFDAEMQKLLRDVRSMC